MKNFKLRRKVLFRWPFIWMKRKLEAVDGSNYIVSSLWAFFRKTKQKAKKKREGATKTPPEWPMNEKGNAPACTGSDDRWF